MTAPAADSPVLLRAEDVRVVYRRAGRRTEAVKGVTFDLREGRCLGIVGESGSGKSSLARALLGLEPDAATGRVLFRGRDVLTMDRDARAAFRREAQMVFQDPLGSLNPRMRAGDALAEVLLVHGRARTRREAAEQAAEWLSVVGLDADYAPRYPHELSGGQRQRVNLARSLCTGATFLIADEPVSALDVSVQARILNLMKDLQRTRGITWILIGHDLAVMRAMADDLLVMQSGGCVESGPASAVLFAPRHPYTRTLLSSVPDVPSSLSRRFAT